MTNDLSVVQVIFSIKRTQIEGLKWLMVTPVTLIQDVSKEEKLLFSGEESATSEQGPLLESGLRVVQVLDLGESGSEKEREKIVKESSMVEADKNGKIGKAQEERLGQLSEESRRDRSHQKRRESLPRNSTWEDISDESDEGTPERDLPGMLPFLLYLLHNSDITTEHLHTLLYFRVGVVVHTMMCRKKGKK